MTITATSRSGASAATAADPTCPSFTSVAGSRLVAIVCTYNADAAWGTNGDVTDSKGGSWTCVAKTTRGANNEVHVGIWEQIGGTRGTSHTVTYATHGLEAANIGVLELTWTGSGLVLDTTTDASAADATSPMTVTAAVALSGTQVAIGGCVLETGGTNATTQPNGYTNIWDEDDGSILLVSNCCYKNNETGRPTLSWSNADTISAGRQLFVSYVEKFDITPVGNATFWAASNADGFTSSSVDTSGANLIVVALATGGSTGGDFTLSDSKNNTWNPLPKQYPGFGGQSRLYYAWDAIVGTGHTFTIAGTDFYPEIVVAWFANARSSSDPYDGTTVGDEVLSASSVQVGPLTPTMNGCLVVTSLRDTRSYTTDSINGGFTKLGATNDDFGHDQSRLGYLIQTTAAEAHPTWTTTGGNDTMVATIAAFRPEIANYGSLSNLIEAWLPENATLSGSNVTALPGAHNSRTLETPATDPTIVTGGLPSGVDSIDINNGGAKYLRLLEANLVAGTSFTFMAMMKWVGTPVDPQRGFSFATSGQADHDNVGSAVFHLTGGGGSGHNWPSGYRINLLPTNGISVDYDTWHLFLGIFDGTNFTSYKAVSGASGWTQVAQGGSTGTFDIDEFRIGAEPSGGQNGHMEIGDVVWFSGAKGSVARQDLFDYAFVRNFGAAATIEATMSAPLGALGGSIAADVTKPSPLIFAPRSILVRK